ncbi:putative galacturan 1,4-alpha-galacturonidase C [Colletotrichum trifolii]|uniref:galacturonan 1,4-alpha-galacturonidase n=1 Tax=Colletotrichum trifolii TaxID=5466 RepID=A0A4R8R8P5_COLTR|nr:putative galacturan 1,4-alpha-galacturonidase C [Colletotrichum trifolii]
MYFENISGNATATKTPGRYNWVQNTDGFDTMDARNITVKGFEYSGGDECVAMKPRSYDIHLEDVTCNGGNRIAIGSLRQHLEDATVEDVMNNLLLKRTTLYLRYGVHIKTWMGVLVPQDHYESAFQPRGGGWGRARKGLFSNVKYENVNNAPSINQNKGNKSSYAGTSKMGYLTLRLSTSLELCLAQTTAAIRVPMCSCISPSSRFRWDWMNRMIAMGVISFEQMLKR